MLKLTIIGNLTADAVVKDFGGRQYAAFTVAENHTRTGADGVKRESVTYVSCLRQVRDGSGGVMPWLKKGTQVYVEGRANCKPFTRNDGTQGASLNCSVDVLQLLSGGRRGEETQNAFSDTRTQPAPGNSPAAPTNAPQAAKNAPGAWTAQQATMQMHDEDNDLPF